MINNGDSNSEQHNPSSGVPWFETLTLLLPCVAIGLMTYNITVVTTPDIMPIWMAIPIGFGVSCLLLAAGIITSGSDMSDVIATSIVFIFLSLLWLPAAPQMKAQRHRKKAMEAAQIKRMTPAPTPPPLQATSENRP